MQGDFEISGVYARPYAGEKDKNEIEVVVHLGGGAAGRAIVPAGAGSAVETLDYIKTTLAKNLVSTDSYKHHVNSNATDWKVDSEDREGGDTVQSAVSLAVSRACAAQMKSSVIAK